MKTSLTNIAHLRIYRKLSSQKKFNLNHCVLSTTFEGVIYNNKVISESEAEDIVTNACSKFVDILLDVNTFGKEPTFENIVVAILYLIRNETFLIKKVSLCKNENIIYEVSY